MRAAVRSGAHVRVEHDLGQAVAVPHVNENKAAMVAAELHPAHQADVVAHVFGAKLVQVVGTHPSGQVFNLAYIVLIAHGVPSIPSVPCHEVGDPTGK